MRILSERDKAIIRRVEEGKSYAATGREFGISGSMVKVVFVNNEYQVKIWGENVPDTRMVNAIFNASGTCQYRHGWERAVKKEILKLMAGMSCRQISKAKGCGKQTFTEILEWCIIEEMELDCGCPGTCNVLNDELKEKIQVKRNKIAYYEGEIERLERSLVE